MKDASHAAVLCSGGLDSAVLLADALARGPAQPIYVSVGLAWEREERDAMARLLARAPLSAAAPIVQLRVDMRDVYPPDYWAVQGSAPTYDTPDGDVYITGRNVVLLAKASVFMARAGLSRVALGTLAGNPFPDASPAFFAAIGRALALGLAHPIEIEAPFAGMHKGDVIRLGAQLGVPMQLSLSCMQPEGGRHCGACSKCRERIEGFREAGVEDRTEYVRVRTGGA